MNNPNDYRVGDRVVIAPKEFLEEKGIKYYHENYLQGTDRVVELVRFDQIKLWHGNAVNNNMMPICFPEAAILGHAFEWGQEIEVRDHAHDNWERVKFYGYAIGHSCPVKVGGREVSYLFARPIRKAEKIEHEEPEIFLGKLDGIYYSTPNGNYEPEDIAKHYQANYPDWEFLGFYEHKGEGGGVCGSWHAEKQYPGGVIKLLPYAKFRRKAK